MTSLLYFGLEVVYFNKAEPSGEFDAGDTSTAVPVFQRRGCVSNEQDSGLAKAKDIEPKIERRLWSNKMSPITSTCVSPDSPFKVRTECTKLGQFIHGTESNTTKKQ